MESVNQNGQALKYASSRLQDDSTIVMEAVKQNGWALEHASERLKDDASIVMEAAKKNGKTLVLASKRLKDDADIVREAVKQKGWALQYASDRLKDDAYIVREAVKNSGKALRYASERLKDDAGIVLEAIKGGIQEFMHENNDPDACHYHLEYFRLSSQLLQRNKEFVRLAALLYKDVPNHYLHDLVWCLDRELVKELFQYLLDLQNVSEETGITLSFIEEGGKQAATTVISFARERLWLLGQVSGPMPTSIIKLVDVLSDQDLSKEVRKAVKLIEWAPILSAFEYCGMTWKELLFN
jgi:hypothetical protein